MNCKGLLLIWIMLCSLGQQLTAGAWPRGTGKAFVSSSASTTWPKGRAFEYPDVYGGGYAEYGLSKRLTFGMDFGSSDATSPSKLKAISFVRYTLSTAQARHQFAVDLGGGKTQGDMVVRLGASYGTGITAFEKSGWISLETHALINPETELSSQTIDATVGLNLKRGKLIGMFSAYRAPSGQSTFAASPSFALDMGRGRHLEIGATFDLQSSADPALKLGIWQEF